MLYFALGLVWFGSSCFPVIYGNQNERGHYNCAFAYSYANLLGEEVKWMKII